MGRFALLAEYFHRHQIQAAGPVALLLEAAVADFRLAVEEPRCAPGKKISVIGFRPM